MIRISNDTGGRPIKNEDLQKFVQSFDNWSGFLEELNNGEPLILYGIEITGGGPYGITSGVIYFEGDLCIYDGGTGISLPNLLKVNVGSDPREFFDGVTKNTINTIKVIDDLSGTHQLTESEKRLTDFTPSQEQVDKNTTDFGGLVTKVVEIGTWDMVTTATKDVSHGIADYTKIRSIDITIIDDNGDLVDFNGADSSSGDLGGIWKCPAAYSTVIKLSRVSSSFFNSTLYDGAVDNRGYAVIQYVE